VPMARYNDDLCELIGNGDLARISHAFRRIWRVRASRRTRKGRPVCHLRLWL